MKKQISCALLLLLFSSCSSAPSSKVYELGEVPDPSDFGETGVFESFDYTVPGDYSVILKNASGKQRTVRIIIEDTSKPEWEYFTDQVITEVGKKPDYYFSAKDESDVEIEVHDEQLDINTPGLYDAYVLATDASGNRLRGEFMIEVREKTEMPATVISHIDGPGQKELADQVLEVLNSDSEDHNVIVSEDVPEDVWNSIYHVDYAVCDALGWEYMDITEGFETRDGSYQISVNPGKVKARAMDRTLEDVRLQNLSDKAGIKKSDSKTEKARKIRDFIVDSLTYTSEEIYPSTAIQQKKGNSMTYAMLFDEMAEYNDIPSDFVTGYFNDTYHAWNRIWIDGQPKWIDLVLDSAKPGSYFMSDKLWDDHELSITEIKSADDSSEEDQ